MSRDWIIGKLVPCYRLNSIGRSRGGDQSRMMVGPSKHTKWATIGPSAKRH